MGSRAVPVPLEDSSNDQYATRAPTTGSSLRKMVALPAPLQPGRNNASIVKPSVIAKLLATPAPTLTKALLERLNAIALRPTSPGTRVAPEPSAPWLPPTRSFAVVLVSLKFQ